MQDACEKEMLVRVREAFHRILSALRHCRCIVYSTSWPNKYEDIHLNSLNPRILRPVLFVMDFVGDILPDDVVLTAVTFDGATVVLVLNVCCSAPHNHPVRRVFNVIV